MVWPLPCGIFFSRVSIQSSHRFKENRLRIGAVASRIGKYQLFQELGAGGMRVVYAAFDTQKRTRFCCNQDDRRARRDSRHPSCETWAHEVRSLALDQRRRISLVREARLASQLHPPPTSFRYLTMGNMRACYVVMEYVEGSISPPNHSDSSGDHPWVAKSI